MMSEPSVAEYQAFARPRIEAGGYDWETFRKQLQQESGWRHLNANGDILTSYTGTSKGISQLNQNFYPPEVWRDAWTNLWKGIELATGYLARFGSHRKALAAFNWGPGNVGGYRDAAGRVHPAWDGTREWRCPHEAVVAQCRTSQRDHYLDVILGPGWPEPGTTVEGPITMTVFEDFRDPAPAGRFSRTPKGIILHGSRSGRAGNPLDQEYLGTARWAQTNPNDLGWNATIGDGKVAVHLTPQEWGWNARAASQHYLAVEIAQPTAADRVTDGQVVALVDWIKRHVLPAWPALPMHFPTHAEVEASGETGQRDGKTDAFPAGDVRADELRGRIMAMMTGDVPAAVPDPGPARFSVGQGILQAMAANADDPACDELFFKSGERDAWSEAYGTSGARYVWLPATGRVHRYDPAA